MFLFVDLLFKARYVSDSLMKRMKESEVDHLTNLEKNCAAICETRPKF